MIINYYIKEIMYCYYNVKRSKIKRKLFNTIIRNNSNKVKY